MIYILTKIMELDTGRLLTFTEIGDSLHTCNVVSKVDPYFRHQLRI